MPIERLNLFSHSTGIRLPIVVSQFSACFPHYFIVLGPWHSCNILLGPVSRRELATPKQTDSALNGCGILRKRNGMSEVLIVRWLSLGKIASSGDILPQLATSIYLLAISCHQCQQCPRCLHHSATRVASLDPTSYARMLLVMEIPFHLKTSEPSPKKNKSP